MKGAVDVIDIMQWFVELVKRDMNRFTLEPETDSKITAKIYERRMKGDMKDDIRGGN